jgi:uncharacterized protein YegL
MSFDGLARKLQEVSDAVEALDGELTTVKFDPTDQTSVEAAISQVSDAIDAKIASYRGNEMVENIATELKEKYTQQILDRAATARMTQGTEAVITSNIDPTILRQIENTVTDLRSSEYQSFDKHIKKLSRLLHSTQLEPVTAALTEGIDLETWLKAGHATQGGMVGSAQLEWPANHEKELGTTILLADKICCGARRSLNLRAHVLLQRQ